MTERMFRVAWVAPDGTEGLEVLPMAQAGMLVGSLMGIGIGVIGIHDHAVWLMLDADRAEVDALAKSPHDLGLS